jgi:hypothetical protein
MDCGGRYNGSHPQGMCSDCGADNWLDEQDVMERNEYFGEMVKRVQCTPRDLEELFLMTNYSLQVTTQNRKTNKRLLLIS